MFYTHQDTGLRFKETPTTCDAFVLHIAPRANGLQYHIHAYETKARVFSVEPLSGNSFFMYEFDRETFDVNDPRLNDEVHNGLTEAFRKSQHLYDYWVKYEKEA